MDDIWLWIMTAAMAVAVLAVLLRGLVRTGGAVPADDAEVQVYRDQLSEVERDQARGTLAPDEAQRLRAEIARRLLEADRSGSRGPAPAKTGSVLVPAVLVAAAIAAAFAVYIRLGVPGYPDLPLKSRLADLDAGIANRPSQAAELERAGRTPDPALISATRERLAAATDPAGLQDEFRTAFSEGRLSEAVLVMERRIAMLGDKASAADHASLALALVAEADGYVSPEAEAELRKALELDMQNELALYLVGEMFLQGGRFDLTFRFWRPLLEGGDPNSPWVMSIRDRIESVAQLAGIPYTLPAPAGGPSAADMAAAADMTPEERQAMIEGMVEQLSQRLSESGGSAEEWAKLIRALGVLGRTEDAAKRFDEAKAQFAGQEEALAILAQAAADAGLAP